MAEGLDLKTVVKHLTNGTFGDNLCLVCLLPFTEYNCENIFTTICKIDKEYCTADILSEVCQIKIQDSEYYNICYDCFQSASTAYRFYLHAKRSYEILNFYTDQLLSNSKDLKITEEDGEHLLCIPLPMYTPKTPGFDYGFDGIHTRKMGDDIATVNDSTKKYNNKNVDSPSVENYEEISKSNSTKTKNVHTDDSDDENIIMIVNEKKRKKRDPMVYISCMHCPVRYRFLSKLKDHVKRVHNVDMYYCKICKLVSDNKDNYEEHILTHSGEYQCTQCNAVYRRQESLITHMKSHENIDKSQQINVANGNICEVCGVVLADEQALTEHRALRHVLKYTCYFCGRMYKGRASFEMHINKHEEYLKNKNKQRKPTPKTRSEKRPDEDDVDSSPAKRSICGVCGKSFVDERSLLWHQRLHNNDKPFVCDVCSRGFVSVNRRNQHALCAHSPPARRCPLCPALFHLRSMVNTHLKKVHLNKRQKRRNRVAKPVNVFWRTETVPIQELSVSIQNEVLEMQNSQDKDWKDRDSKQLEDANFYKKPNAIHYTNQLSYNIGVKDLPNDIMMPEAQEFEFSDSSQLD